MILPNCVVKPNLKENPTYPYSQSDHYFELTGGKFVGLHFNFTKIELDTDNNGKKIKFEYNLLYIPEHVSLVQNSNDENVHFLNMGSEFSSLANQYHQNTIELENVISEILQQIIERGYYEFDTKR